MPTRKLVATIANGATTSSSIDTAGLTSLVMQTPAALTSTSFAFHVATDDATFVPLYDSTGTTAVGITVTTSRAYVLPTSLNGARLVRIVCAAEGGARTITFSGKG